MILFDASASDNAGALSFTHTCTGNNLILIVGVQYRDITPASSTGVTYNGVAMTLIDSLIGVGAGVDITSELWYLINPATGANTVAVTSSPASPTRATAGSMSFTGVVQSSAAIDASNKANTSSTTASVSVTANNRNVMLVGSIMSRVTAGIAPIGSVVETYDISAGTSDKGWGGYLGLKASGPTTFSATVGSGDWAIVAAALKPISGPSTTNKLRPHIFSPGLAR